MAILDSLGNLAKTIFGSPSGTSPIDTAVNAVGKVLAPPPVVQAASKVPTVKTTQANQNPPTTTLKGPYVSIPTTTQQQATMDKNAALMKNLGPGNYTINPDGSVSPKVSTPVTDKLNSAPPQINGPIDASSYNPTIQPMNPVPAGTTPENASNIINAGSLALAVHTDVTNKINDLQNQKNQLTAQMGTVSDPASLQRITDAQNQIDNYTQLLTPLQTQLQGYNQQLADLNNQMNAELGATEGQAVPTGIITGQKANIQRKYAIEIANISAQSSLVASQIQTIQGNEDAAYKAISTTASLMNFNVSQERANLQTFIDNYDTQLSTLNSQDKSALDQLFGELQTQESEQFTQNRDKLTYAADAAKYGINVGSVDDLKNMSVEDVVTKYADELSKKPPVSVNYETINGQKTEIVRDKITGQILSLNPLGSASSYAVPPSSDFVGTNNPPPNQ